MAITVGNTSSSGDAGSPDTAYSWSHECQADTNLLVVTTRVRDSSIDDADVSGITYDGNPLAEAISVYTALSDLGSEVWYLADPPVGSSLTIEVTHGGKCSDASGAAIGLKGVDTNDIVDGTDIEEGLNSIDSTLVVDPAATGSMLVGSMCNNLSSVATLSVTTGTEIDEVDMGNYCGGAGYNPASGGTATLVWEWVGGENQNAAGATFNPSVGPPPAGQPMIIRTRGIPTGPGSRIGGAGWN